MRVSTGMIYDSGLASIQNRTSTLLRTQQQLSTGRRILAPSDDPVAAARALEVTQSLAANKAQAETRNNVKNAVGIADAQLQSAMDLLGRVRELTVQAGDAALSSQDRRSIALELRQRFDELIAIANAKDGLGNSLFGGFQVGNKPFAGSVEDGVRYLGDDGLRALQVSASRQLGISQSGNDIFMRIQNGNGVFATATQNEKSINATHITYEGLSAALVNPPTPPAGGNFEIRFWTDTAGGNAPSPAQVTGTTDLTALAYPYSFNAGDQFSVTIDANPAATITLNPPASFADEAAVLSAIQSAIGNTGTVNLDTQGRLTFTSATSGATSSVTLADVTGTPLTVLMGGVPAPVTGTTGAANSTYYDLVDSNGNSLFTGAPSTTGGGANTYTHTYTSGTAITLNSAGPLAFDYGASVVFTGAPTDGDSFAVTRTATALSVLEENIVGKAARATIDSGTVSDPLKWSQAANSGDLEVRFWVDTAGTVASAAQSVATSAPIYPMTFTDGVDDVFSVTIDGGAPINIDLDTAGPSTTYLTPAALLSVMQTAVGAAGTVNFDADGKLTFTSNSTGSTSSLALANVTGTPLTTLMGGVPAPVTGADPIQGQTFYDLVDATTGKSLFTDTESTTGGAGNTFTHAYTSAVPISLSSPGGTGPLPVFDFGASVTITGVPAGGDTFTIKASQDYTGNGYFVTAAKTATAYNTGSGIIGTGDILDPAKWNHPANSRNLEVRFWQDPADLSVPPTTYYDLVDAETERSLFTNAASTAGGSDNTYVREFNSGDSIDFAGLAIPYGADTISDFGISVTINGEPASGDAFKVQASASQSVFETLAKTIQLLESGKPIETMGNVQLSNELGSILTGISRAEDNVLSARAVFGTGLAEVDSLDSVGESLSLQFEESLSRLQDLDYADAITKLTRQQMELQAAQQSFSRISQLTLFDYIR